jgi:hypothetical protein
MSYVDIQISGNVVRLLFNNIPVTDSLKTTMPRSAISSISLSDGGGVSVRLTDGRAWIVSTVSEYVQDTYPIREVNGVTMSSNSDLYNSLETIF